MNNKTFLNAILLIPIILIVVINCGKESPTEDVTPHISTPRDPSPTHNTSDLQITRDLEWKITREEGVRYSFDVYFDTLPNPKIVSAKQTDSIYNPGELLYETNYYWKIVVFSHLGDVITGPVWKFTITDPGGVFAVLEIDSWKHSPSFQRDYLRARFDFSYAPKDPITPLQATSVMGAGVNLEWIDSIGYYNHSESDNPFIHNSTLYTFDVDSSSDVPFLTQSILTPICAPVITSPLFLESVLFSGFEVQWDNTCYGNVWLTIMKDLDSTGVWVNTQNDGSYTFTEEDLAPLNNEDWTYRLIIIFQNESKINASGFDPRSIIRSRTFDIVHNLYIVNH